MSKNLEYFSLSQALRFQIKNDGKLYASLSHSSGEFFVAPEVLGILCQIAQCQGSFDAKKFIQNLHTDYKHTLQTLPSAQECKEIVDDLCAAGLVLTKSNNAREMQQDGFGDEWIQWAMLADSPRCLAYEKAIANSVNEKSVVVDVGAGSGFLSALSLAHKAQKVVAIEETNMAKNIVPLLKKLNLPHTPPQFTMHNHNSSDVSLPKNTTHIVSELFGNDPFSEGVIHTLRNISEQFSQQPQYIPQSVQVYFEAVDILEHPIKHRIEAVFKAQNQQKIGLSVTQHFLQAAREKFNFKGVSFPIALSKNSFTRVCKPTLLGELPLNPPRSYANKKNHPLYGEKRVKILKNVQCSLGLLWFKVTLIPGITLSSHPHENDRCEHWSPVAFLLEKNLGEGDEIDVKHQLNEFETKVECEIFSQKIKIGGQI